MALIDKIARGVVAVTDAVKGNRTDEPSSQEILAAVVDALPTDVGKLEVVVSDGRLEVIAMQQGRESWKSAAARATKAKSIAGGVLEKMLPHRQLKHVKKQEGKKVWGVYVDRDREGAGAGIKWQTPEERRQEAIRGGKSYRTKVNQ